MCTSLPSHCLPPCCGAGLAHRRVLCLVPPPQETLQAPQLTQEDHFPSTEGAEVAAALNFYLSNEFSIREQTWICTEISLRRSDLSAVLEFSPGQGLSLHTCVWVSEPSHCSPSNAGGGLLHSRTLDCIPLPQVSLHGLHGSQDPQLPATTCTSVNI